MKRRRLGWWLGYAVGSAALMGVLGAVTVSVLALEENGRQSQRLAAEEALVRRALWRMDTWFAPLLAHEANRSPAEYQALSQNPFADPALSGDQLQYSPILVERNAFFPLHFETTPAAGGDGLVLVSPQVPLGDARDNLVQNGIVTSTQFAQSCEVLQETEKVVDADSLARFEKLEKEVLSIIEASTETREVDPDLSWYANPKASPDVERNVSKIDKTARQAINSEVTQNYQQRKSRSGKSRKAQQESEPVRVGEERVGPFVPIWAEGSGPEMAKQLIFLRRVGAEDRERFQGFTVDWPELSGALLEVVEGLAPNGQLRPVTDRSAGSANEDISVRWLTTVPAEFSLPPLPTPPATWTPERSVLVAAWIAVVLAIAMTGLGLRAIVRYSDRRSRFASAVTHELRTPLTTFQLYTEMLSEGLIKDEAKRREYLETLHHESHRLGSIVENVLSFARIDEGRQPFRVQQTSAREIVESIQSTLERRAAEEDLELHVSIEERILELRTDHEAIHQILFNLVDNAAKYAADGEPNRIEVDVRREGSECRFSVRDYGSGLTRPQERTVFQTFDRGGRESTNIPGVGLGLPLARALAKELGGSLHHEAANPGARFVLSLPTSGRA